MTLEAFSFHRILRGTPETLAVTFTEDGVAADPGDVTVTITRADGTALVTDDATTGSGKAAREYALTAAQTARLDVLTAVWSGTVGGQAVSVTTTVEVVGAHLFSIAQARNFGRKQLQSAAGFSVQVIEEARARITDAFESICGISFIPRYRQVTLDGTDDHLLLLPDLHITAIHDVAVRTWGTASWTVYDSDDLADLFVDTAGVLVRESRGTFAGGRRNVRIGYEYGLTQPPLEISRAALKVLESTAYSSNLPDRATWLTDELGSFRLIVADAATGHWFGIPEVDAVLARYQHRVPGIA